jgi:hypothetical protein
MCSVSWYPERLPLSLFFFSALAAWGAVFAPMAATAAAPVAPATIRKFLRLCLVLSMF